MEMWCQKLILRAVIAIKTFFNSRTFQREYDRNMKILKNRTYRTNRTNKIEHKEHMEHIHNRQREKGN